MLASLHPSHTRRVPKMTFWTRRRVVAAACCPCSARSAGRETPSRSACAIASFRAVWLKFIRDSSTGAVRSPPQPDRAYPARSRDRRHLVAYHNFSLNGSGTGEVGEYVGAIEVIAKAEAAGKRVLVHCRAGDRRTGGVVAAYQTIVRREPWSRALLELERFSHKPLEHSAPATVPTRETRHDAGDADPARRDPATSPRGPGPRRPWTGPSRARSRARSRAVVERRTEDDMLRAILLAAGKRT